MHMHDNRVEVENVGWLIEWFWTVILMSRNSRRANYVEATETAVRGPDRMMMFSHAGCGLAALLCCLLVVHDTS